MSVKIVYLAGFMATGKSTIGPILANTLGWNFYDIDKLIEDRYGISIGELFERKGEKKFRNIEKNILEEIKPSEHTIVALGGGTILNQQNLNLMKKKGIIILFESSESQIYHRMKNKKRRPLALTQEGDILDEKELRMKIRNLLKERSRFYEQADIKINTANERVGITVDKLAKILKSELKNAKKN